MKLEEIFKIAEKQLKAPRKKCIVFTKNDYEVFKKNMVEFMGAKPDADKIKINSFNGINVYEDETVAFSFSMFEDIYLESKRLHEVGFITPLNIKQ